MNLNPKWRSKTFANKWDKEFFFNFTNFPKILLRQPNAHSTIYTLPVIFTNIFSGRRTELQTTKLS